VAFGMQVLLYERSAKFHPELHCKCFTGFILIGAILILIFFLLFIYYFFFDYFFFLQAFTQLYLVRVFAEAVEKCSGNLRSVMEKLFQLFAVSNILSSLGDYLVVR
jgi:hypothetical protein